MTDITTVWDVNHARGDYQVIQGSLLGGTDLETAVLISLFTDRIANADDVINDGTKDPRGWACDDLTQPIGSRLWLLNRSTNNAQVPINAKTYCSEALQWLINDGIAQKIDITCQLQSPNNQGPKTMLAIQIVIWQQSQPTTFRYAYVWAQLAGAPAPMIAGQQQSAGSVTISKAGGGVNTHTHG